MSRKIKTYDAEFKNDAVDYVEKHPELSVQSVAEMLGIPRDTLYGWIKAKRRKDLAGDNAPRKGNLSEEEKEILRLKRELKDTQDALEILKKAISILGD